MTDRLVGISVVGHGKVSAVPDLVLVYVTANSEASSAAAANEQASVAMRAMLAAASSAGVADADRRTLSMNLSSWRPDVGRPMVFQANQRLLLRLRDVAGSGEVVQAVLVAGGNNAGLDSFQLTVEDPAPYLDRARDLAMADARHRADELARLAGREVGYVLAVSEGVGGVGGPQPMYRSAKSWVESGDASAPVEGGELEIDMSVTVEYAWAD
ncbi:SIMPL domain-containing protein [Tenggerimyces flavus]|uniref:SIMPL domain-containing protein n=1 Tax=Tenggerimyces flavus TaxID=1708749 RepID=A0ABV7Y7P5_9ACTN|nr:SIMPL domain-containing protein [Tenggerimyces flavus]MBM7785732.1 uncharacterized protein YggE [Tenggerimyces flavus]